MKTVALMALLALLGALPPAVANDGNTGKWIMFGTSNAAIIADWGTTLGIDCEKGYWERNTALGECPSRGAVNKYFTSLLLLHGLLNYGIQQVPDADWREGLFWVENIGVTLGHGGWALKNLSIGLTFNFVHKF